ncbi:hypothetical protein B0H19DRAFT_1219963 [Mycena capillaripes]|nr:hypothetical protein B0H19DRAFT_1219963 [Mycena capillaripes]
MSPCAGLSTQVPLRDATDRWNLNKRPDPNSTGQLVFDTVSSLLQSWPNTRYYSGHTIVPGTIPTGTLLYHGRNDSYIPSTPEWVATDAEFARFYCLDLEQCWLLTLVTTRPLRVLYFDGSSGIKAPDGRMDTQDLLIWGAVLPERATIEWEYERLRHLCELANELGVDAYIRMQINFEIMLCDFTTGVQVATLSRLEEELRYPHHEYAFLQAAAWHDHNPGETRIHLDLTHLVSLYDVALAPSLIPRRYGQARHNHRVLGIDAHDARVVTERVRAIPVSPSTSGIDWRALFQAIRDRYATRIEVLQSILAEGVSAHRAFGLLNTALVAYRLHSAVPPPTGWDTVWAEPVFRLCATTHTLFIESLEVNLTTSEILLLASVQETTREICRTLVGMWAEGVLELRHSARLSSYLVQKWKSDVDRLIDWLGWSVWVKCRPAYRCYAPSLDRNVSEPQCMRLFEPYDI